MKRFMLFFLIVMICFIAILYGEYGKANVKLTENKSVTKQEDDFILHMQINDTGEGIEVLRSIQYMGEESVEIEHQSPLISVSIVNKNHDFTGSTVRKVLKKGNIYHPEKAITFNTPNEKECHLYVNARFQVNGEKVSIEHVENLKFN